MKRTFLAVVAAAFVGSLTVAHAQVVVAPGQEFYGTPTAKAEMTTMPDAKIKMDAPAPKKMMMKKKIKKKMMMKKKKM